MSNNIKILLVEDNPGDVRLIQEMLRETDIRFNLECVDTLSKGIEYLNKGAVDVVVLDLGLPDSQGIDTLVKINTSWPHVPIVIITGLHDGVIGNKSIQKGAQDYLIKGQIDSNILGRTLRYAIERKKMEERLKHLNLVLRAIRRVNQLIIREKDRNKLINKTCKILIKTRGYSNVWIVLLDEEGKFVTSAEAGLGEKFAPLKEWFKGGKLNECGKRALKQSEVVAIEDPVSTCGDCPLLGHKPGVKTLTIRLGHKDKIFGLISVYISSRFTAYEEEQTLFKEIAGDIAFGLHSIEVEEKRKQVEEALWESEERYRDLIETSHEIIQSVKSDDRFDFVNKAWHDILGYTKKELSKLSLFDIIHPESLEHCKKMFKKVLAGESVTNVEAKFMAKDGSTVFVEGNVTGRYIDGKLVATHGFFRDITEHKRLEQQREKSRKEAEFYADVLAHDIGNLDQITLGYLYLLKNAKDDETKKKNMEGIKKSIMKSKRLAESIKTLKIIKDTPLEKFDLNESIERSVEKIKEYSDKEIEIKLDMDKQYYVNANDFLDRVSFSILENSVEFTFQDKAIIDIKTEEKKGICKIHIRDRGIGIPKEKKEDILENLETLSKRTGMGLYLTKKILERFNGKFEIKDVEKGTEVVISIPVINGRSVRNVHAQRPDERNERGR